MRWDDCAVQDLKNYKLLETSIQNIEDKINTLNCKFEGIKHYKSGVLPTKGGTSNYENQLLDNIVERERLKLLYKVDRKLLEIINRGLSALDESEKLVLERFFVDRPKNHIQRLMDELGIEQSQVYRLKDKAIKKFTMAMYGITEY